MEIKLIPEYDSDNSHPNDSTAVLLTSLRNEHTRTATRIGIQLDNGRKLSFDADYLADALRALGLRL
jgi:hypothetical protein